MAEEIKNTVVETNQAAAAEAQVKRLTLTGIEGDELDGNINIADLPPLPWTRAAVGEEQFNQLALAAGAGDLKNQRNPSLDPRSFGISRAKRIIREYGLTGEDAKAVTEEGAEIQKQIDAQLPQPKGTRRRAGAPSLSPSKTTLRTSGVMPRA